jgi:protein SCO1/2
VYGRALFGLLAFVCVAGAVAEQPAPMSLAGLERVMVTTPARAIDDFELVTDSGQPMRLSALRGRPLMLFFGYTHCPDLCPTALGKLKSLKKSDASGLRPLRVVFVSIDGDRDDPRSLKTYLGHFSNEFIGLTGEPQQVREIARQFAATVFQGKPAKGSGDYSVDHTNRVYAIDRHGRLRAELYDASVETMGQVAHVLLKEP